MATPDKAIEKVATFNTGPSYMTASLRKVPVVGGSRKTREAAIKTVLKLKAPGNWAEFGVHTGGTARFFLDYLPTDTTFTLFDSFEGLPEAWDKNHPPGHFSCEVPKFSDKRVQIVKGWFDDTVARWARQQTAPLSFVHVDSDIYSSAKTILAECNNLIVPDTIILFDEFFGYEGWQHHEYKAFREWKKLFKRECRYLGRSNNHRLFLQVIR